MLWRKTLVLGVSSAALLWAHPADAVIVATTGAMVEIAPPASFLPEALESSTEIVVLDEGSKFLPGDAFVNAFGPGVHTDSSAPLLMIPAGTPVNTYFVHFDPDGGVVSLTGAVFFEPGEIILGIQTHTPFIDSTDVIGHPTPDYPTGTLTRGFESLPGIDTVTLPFDLGSASFSLIGELGVDQARIFTTIVPEPSALALMGIGGCSALWLARRRLVRRRVL